MDDARLQAALAAAADTERAVRYHLRMTQGQAGEQARGQVVYRHAVALRRSLEEWIDTRAFIAAGDGHEQARIV